MNELWSWKILVSASSVNIFLQLWDWWSLWNKLHSGLSTMLGWKGCSCFSRSIVVYWKPINKLGLRHDWKRGGHFWSSETQSYDGLRKVCGMVVVLLSTAEEILYPSQFHCSKLQKDRKNSIYKHHNVNPVTWFWLFFETTTRSWLLRFFVIAPVQWGTAK